LLLVAGAFWAGANYEQGQAEQYQSAPLCGPGVKGDCRRRRLGTVTDSYQTQDCSGSGSSRSCSTDTYLNVSFSNNTDDSILMSSGAIPKPQFADGKPVTVEYFRGDAELVIAQDEKTQLQTAVNPVGGTHFLRIASIVVGLVGLLFVYLTVTVIRRRRRSPVTNS
jgi:hypothetical protein